MTDSPILRDDRTGADLSDDREYRYRLWRTWDAEMPTVAFVMLNPSTADESEDDPTIRRCIGFAKEWGYGTLVVGNLFAYRATDPSELRDHPDPVGPENDERLSRIVDEADKVVVAWGNHGEFQGRGDEVTALLDADLYALDITKRSQPVHPLYQPADAELVPFGDDSEARTDGGEDVPDRGTRWFAEAMWETLPEDARERLRESREQEAGR